MCVCVCVCVSIARPANAPAPLRGTFCRFFCCFGDFFFGFFYNWTKQKKGKFLLDFQHRRCEGCRCHASGRRFFFTFSFVFGNKKLLGRLLFFFVETFLQFRDVDRFEDLLLLQGPSSVAWILSLVFCFVFGSTSLVTSNLTRFPLMVRVVTSFSRSTSCDLIRPVDP